MSMSRRCPQRGATCPPPRRRGRTGRLTVFALLASVAVAGAAARTGAAQTTAGVSAGPERLLAADGHSPRIVMDARQRAVAVWLAVHDFSGGREVYEVLARRLRGDTPLGEPVLAGPPAGDAQDARVAMDARGAFVVVWQEALAAGEPAAAIRGQLFRRDGARRLGELALSPPGVRAAHPEVAMAADGRFAVAWEQADPDPARAVRLATFGAAGARLGHPAVLRARGVDANLLGAVSAGGQSVAVGWTEVSPCPQQPIDPVSAVATFDWSLRPRGEVQRVANDNPCIDGPRVVALAGSELGPLGVFAGRRYSVQRFSPTSGERMGPRTNVAELPPCGQARCERVATVAGDGRGRFVLVWERMQGSGDQYDLFAELYGREGRLRSARFAINDAPSSAAQQPSAALGADGTLLVVWRRDGRELVVRRFRVP